MNGFDDLERQLRRHIERDGPQRTRRRLRVVVLGACLFVCAGAVTAAATGVISGTVLSGRDRVTPIEKLLTDVTNATAKTPGCHHERAFGRTPARISTLPAKPETIRAFPQLRRAPTAHERALGRKYGRLGGTQHVLSGGARELRATDGTRFILIITAGRRQASASADPVCVARQRAELARRAASYAPSVVAEARRSLDRAAETSRASIGREELQLLELRPDGRLAGGGGTYSDDAIHRGTGSTGGRVIGGLVPAPADHVILRPRTGNAKAIRIPVPNNVFHKRLPKGFGNHVVIEWRAPDGRLLHVLKPGG